MALWGKKTTSNQEELSNIEKLKLDLKKKNNIDSRILETVEVVEKSPENNIFATEEEFIIFINTIVNNRNLNTRDFTKIYEDARTLYQELTRSGHTFESTFIHLFQFNGLYERDLISIEMMSAFEFVENYFSVMSMIMSYDIPLKNMEETKRLVLALASFLPNDIELRSMIAYFLVTSKLTGNYSNSVDEFIGLAKKRAGIYDDLDEAYIAKIEELVKKSMEVVDRYKAEENKIQKMNEELRTTRANVESIIKTFDESLDRVDKTMNQMAEKHIEKIEQEYLDKYAKLRNDYNDLVKKLITSTEVQAQQIARDAVARFEREAEAMADLKEKYRITTTDELSQINKIKQEATKEVQAGLSEIKNLLETSGISKDTDFSKLNELLKNLDSFAPSKSVSTDSAIVIPETKIVSQDVMTFNGAITSSEQGIKIPDVIPYLDNTVSFKKRYKDIMERKRCNEEKGTVYNSVIDDCIYFILDNERYIYLYGPSGAGKNYIVQQLSELFGVPSVSIGYINEEYELTGGRTASGAYSPSEMYECWRNGYFAFADEFDNGNPQATVKMNGFMDSTDSYKFPVIGFVKKHPNFRIIAAGNTKGMGLTRAHNARQKFDEATQQRLEFIYLDYDNKVEESILKGHKEWLDFIRLYREAVFDYWSHQNDDIQGQITTKDIQKIANDLDRGILDTRKILTYQFIEAKDDDYLSNVASYMMGNDSQLTGEGRKLVKEFNSLASQARRNG